MAMTRNDRVLLSCVGLVAAMGGLAYASVPLYQLFCQVTGFGGTTQVASQAPDTSIDRIIRVRFDANVNSALPWDFAPEQAYIDVRVGDTGIAFYNAKNDSPRPIVGTATYNVTPMKAGQYFNKIQCFCFEEQTLAAGQSVDMPVLFFVDPAIADDPSAAEITEITLSYTFYPALNADAGAALAADQPSN